MLFILSFVKKCFYRASLVAAIMVFTVVNVCFVVVNLFTDYTTANQVWNLLFLQLREETLNASFHLFIVFRIKSRSKKPE